MYEIGKKKRPAKPAQRKAFPRAVQAAIRKLPPKLRASVTKKIEKAATKRAIADALPKTKRPLPSRAAMRPAPQTSRTPLPPPDSYLTEQAPQAQPFAAQPALAPQHVPPQSYDDGGYYDEPEYEDEYEDEESYDETVYEEDEDESEFTSGVGFIPHPAPWAPVVGALSVIGLCLLAKRR